MAIEHCPDCDFVSEAWGGNGKCNECHGTGVEQDFFEALAESLSSSIQACKNAEGRKSVRPVTGKVICEPDDSIRI